MMDWKTEYDKAVVEKNELAGNLHRANRILAYLVGAHGQDGEVVLSKKALEKGRFKSVSWFADGDDVVVRVGK